MLAIITAIQTAFAANAFLSTTFPNGLELCEAADNEASPIALLIPVSEVPVYNNHGNYTSNTHFQFTIRSASGLVVAQVMDTIKQIYDHKPLTLSSNETLADTRIVGINRIFKEDERMFRGDVEYRFRVCGSLF